MIDIVDIFHTLFPLVVVLMVSALVVDAAAVAVVRIISLFLSLKVCKDERFAVEMRSHSAALKTGGSESEASAAATISEMPGLALLHTARFSVRFVQPLSLSLLALPQ